MNRCLIVFDLDTELLKSNYNGTSWNNGYADIQHLLNRHRFNNIQGTVYLSEPGVRQAHATVALQDVTIRFPWFEKCASNVHFYDLAGGINTQFIIDGIIQARIIFHHRLAELHQQLMAAGLTQDMVDEIVVKQAGPQAHE